MKLVTLSEPNTLSILIEDFVLSSNIRQILEARKNRQISFSRFGNISLICLVPVSDSLKVEIEYLT